MFASQFNQLVKFAFRHLPDKLIYSPIEGEAREIAGIFLKQEIPEMQGQTSTIKAKVTIRAADIAEPKYRDKLTIEGIDYFVESIRLVAVDYFELELRRDERLII